MVKLIVRMIDFVSCLILFYDSLIVIWPQLDNSFQSASKGLDKNWVTAWLYHCGVEDDQIDKEDCADDDQLASLIDDPFIV